MLQSSIRPLMASSRSNSSSFFFLLLLLLFTNSIKASAASSPAPNAPKSATTRLHFYLHEIFYGPNATVAISALPPPTTTSPGSLSTFGAVGVYDNPLTEGPDPRSRLVGRAQGIAAQASQHGGIAYSTTVNLVFGQGSAHAGSTLSVAGRLVPDATCSELSVVGGTGEFRMAQGYVVAKYISSLPGPIVIDYNAYIVRH